MTEAEIENKKTFVQTPASLKGHLFEQTDAVTIPIAVTHDCPHIWEGTAMVEMASCTAPGTFWKRVGAR